MDHTDQRRDCMKTLTEKIKLEWNKHTGNTKKQNTADNLKETEGAGINIIEGTQLQMSDKDARPWLITSEKRRKKCENNKGRN